MTSKAQLEQRAIADRLGKLGIDRTDALALRRIEMTLTRWAEMECGDAHGNVIERDDTTGKPYYTFDGGAGKRYRMRIPDRERGALRRAAAIIARYPGLSYYHQTDPRGCALYILRDADIIQGLEIGAQYNRGTSVCA